MIPQKAHNHIIEDLVDSKGDDSPFAEVKTMMVRIFNKIKVELKEDIQKLLKSQEKWTKKT
jgi:hypothetical protein